MWTYEYMSQYITEKVATFAGDLSLDVYRVNDTTCAAGNYTTVSPSPAVSGCCQRVLGVVCLPRGQRLVGLHRRMLQIQMHGIGLIRAGTLAFERGWGGESCSAFVTGSLVNAGVREEQPDQAQAAAH